MLAKTIIILAAVSAALAAPFTLLPRVDLHKRCSANNLGLPTPTGTVVSSSAITVAAGATFDGGGKRYNRGAGACYAQVEGGDADAVFLLKAGATLKNVIIGSNQVEGVICNGPCTIEDVWFEDVCEVAITIKGDKAGQQSWIRGGGAYKASGSTIVQHNGCGTVNIINFYVNTYGKLYRSCGNCGSQCKRTVVIDGVEAHNGGALAGINSNYGDTATITNACYDTSTPCQMYIGNNSGAEPIKSGTCTG